MDNKFIDNRINYQLMHCYLLSNLRNIEIFQGMKVVQWRQACANSANQSQY